MHEQEIVAVVFQTEIVGDAGALIGTALTPALPISGFSFLSFGKNRFISFTKRMPLAEAIDECQGSKGEYLDGVEGQKF